MAGGSRTSNPLEYRAMTHTFQAHCHAALIGSIPLKDHEQATELILKYTPHIPLWAQLPAYPEEGMIPQFLPGMPGHATGKGTEYVDTGSETFEQDLLEFYEEYMGVTEGGVDQETTRFTLEPDRAKGFHVLTERLTQGDIHPVALKGQITGPITFATGVKDQDKKAIFYNDQLRDAAVKLLALKAGWQVDHLARHNAPVIVFFDEPALAGFGSSEFISISKQDVMDCFSEVIEQVHARGGLAGVHVCANADWSIILESQADILSFDAYAYFDKLLLFKEGLQSFLDRGGIIAWGIVPTLEPEDIEKETADSLFQKLEHQISQLEDLGFDRNQVLNQTLITPSCGTGSLSIELAEKVLQMTRQVSDRIRSTLAE